MVSSPGAVTREGRSSWLGVAAIVLAILLVEAWVVWGGRSPGPVAGSPDGQPLLFLALGQSRTLAPGRLDEGSAVSCERAGLRVVGIVPAVGRTAVVHADPVAGAGGVTIRLVHRKDNSVQAVCGP